ncbi:MAG: TIGR03936 family radical SAM-associated protein [Propionibacteriaceae bacterium]|jgi:radical SAM-linked protein|nr:TIGR03936 family radical SAM-associated protein [Propionibacteriaceae bacterium]
MSRQPERQQPPPVMRVALRYAKRGRARFASHRDFARAFERALRRAEVPMAFSSGFSPHPRISYYNAAPTGAASEAEYLTLALAREVDVVELVARLNDALPDGFEITAWSLDSPLVLKGQQETEVDGASRWRIEFTPMGPNLDTAISVLLATSSYLVRREAKNRDVDVRERLARLELTAPGVLEMTIKTSSPLVRPDDVLNALAEIAGESYTARITRLAQGHLRDDELVELF